MNKKNNGINTDTDFILPNNRKLLNDVLVCAIKYNGIINANNLFIINNILIFIE